MTADEVRTHFGVAQLQLSDETAEVGFDVDGDVWIKIEPMIEPNYMSVAEAEMLICALRVAITKTQGDR